MIDTTLIPTTPLRILVNGLHGKMGAESVKAIQADPELTYIGGAENGDNLAAKIKALQPDVVLDLTVASAVYENARTIIESGVHPVIGTSGLLPEQIEQLTQQCQAQQLGGLIVPNFSIGAILMMKFAALAAKYLNEVEIIELHHEKKQDAPSGTAIKTAEMIAEHRSQLPPHRTERELIAGARGAKHQGIPIHSVRLPGFMAHQVVIFGGKSESLQIQHDSFHREAFMPGVCLACKKVVQLKTLVYGLESLL